MDPTTAEEAAALSAQLESWSAAYFRDDEPLVPDADYDAGHTGLPQRHNAPRPHPWRAGEGWGSRVADRSLR